MTASTRNPTNLGILLFDGVCRLCSGWVSFVFHRDTQARIKFAPLQSDRAQALLERYDIPSTAFLDTIVYIESDKAYIKSTAILKVLKRLKFPWPLLAVALIIPRPIRDWLYDVIARHRYQWFGKRESCLVPNEELNTRFLDSNESLKPQAPDVDTL